MLSFKDVNFLEDDLRTRTGRVYTLTKKETTSSSQKLRVLLQE